MPYTKPVCRGSWALGSACGKCERCEETRPGGTAKPKASGRMKCPHCNGTGELGGDEVHFGALLRAARLAKGWTQEQLAEAVGRSRTQITNLEIGGRSDVPLTLVLKCAMALDISAKDLIP